MDSDAAENKINGQHTDAPAASNKQRGLLVTEEWLLTAEVPFQGCEMAQRRITDDKARVMTHSWHSVSTENISHPLKSASPGYPSALALRVNRTVLLLAISRGQPQYGFWFQEENWFRSSADLIKSRVIEIDLFLGWWHISIAKVYDKGQWIFTGRRWCHAPSIHGCIFHLSYNNNKKKKKHMCLDIPLTYSAFRKTLVRKGSLQFFYHSGLNQRDPTPKTHTTCWHSNEATFSKPQLHVSGFQMSNW